jgi:hypothetical protein
MPMQLDALTIPPGASVEPSPRSSWRIAPNGLPTVAQPAWPIEKLNV